MSGVAIAGIPESHLGYGQGTHRWREEFGAYCSNCNWSEVRRRPGCCHQGVQHDRAHATVAADGPSGSAGPIGTEPGPRRTQRSSDITRGPRDPVSLHFSRLGSYRIQPLAPCTTNGIAVIPRSELHGSASVDRHGHKWRCIHALSKLAPTTKVAASFVIVIRAPLDSASVYSASHSP